MVESRLIMTHFCYFVPVRTVLAVEGSESRGNCRIQEVVCSEGLGAFRFSLSTVPRAAESHAEMPPASNK